MYEHEHEATKGIWALDMNWKCTGIICLATASEIWEKT